MASGFYWALLEPASRSHCRWRERGTHLSIRGWPWELRAQETPVPYWRLSLLPASHNNLAGITPSVWQCCRSLSCLSCTPSWQKTARNAHPGRLGTIMPLSFAKVTPHGSVFSIASPSADSLASRAFSRSFSTTNTISPECRPGILRQSLLSPVAFCVLLVGGSQTALA